MIRHSHTTTFNYRNYLDTHFRNKSVLIGKRLRLKRTANCLVDNLQYDFGISISIAFGDIGILHTAIKVAIHLKVSDSLSAGNFSNHGRDETTHSDTGDTN